MFCAHCRRRPAAVVDCESLRVFCGRPCALEYIAGKRDREEGEEENDKYRELKMLRMVPNPSSQLVELIKKEESKLVDEAAEAIQKCDTKTLKSILDVAPSVVNTTTSAQRTLLQNALLVSKKCGEDSLILLLHQPDIDVNKQTEYGMSALHIAADQARNVSENALALLLARHDIKVNLQDEAGDTPFSLAVAFSGASSNGGTETPVEMLLRHPDTDVNLPDNEGRRPLIYAVVHIKLKQGSDFVPDISERVVEMLLAHPKIDPNATNRGGRTALMLASAHINSYSSERAVELLLSHPKTDIMKRTNEGKTALDLCPTISGKLLIWTAWNVRHAFLERGAARLLAARTLQTELCEHISDRANRPQIIELARALGVPPAIVDGEWTNLSKSELCKNVSDILAIGGYWDAEKYNTEYTRRTEKRRQLQVMFERFRQGLELATGVDLRRNMTWGELEDYINKF